MRFYKVIDIMCEWEFSFILDRELFLYIFFWRFRKCPQASVFLLLFKHPLKVKPSAVLVAAGLAAASTAATLLLLIYNRRRIVAGIVDSAKYDDDVDPSDSASLLMLVLSPRTMSR